MSIAVTNTTIVAVTEEVTEGTYVAPSAASDFIQTLASGLEVKPTKELLERNVFSGSIGKITPRTGQRSVSCSIPVEARADATEGSAPEYNLLMKSVMGDRRQNTTVVTSKASGNTASVIQIEDADISKFAVGDIVLVKMTGAYHVSPITARATGAGVATITLLVAHPSGDITDSATIAKFTTYLPAESGHPTLSISKYVDSAILEKAYGVRINKFSLSNFATGKIPELQFSGEGLNFDRSLTAPSYTPSYDAALPPIVLDAKAYLDGSSITINELALSVENTIGFSTSITASNGKISSRVTSRKVTGTIDPYQATDSIANYTKFVNNTEFSLFAYAKNENGTTGEMQNIIAVYMPKCLVTELGQADASGLVQEKISFTASRGSDGATNEIYYAVI